MFRKVIIANRGEIACRVIRTCRRMGISTVALYSDADSSALHVQMADESHLLGPSPAPESYLNIQRILQIARETDADALHPGYGFLSENAGFVNACDEAGIRFIGPHPETMIRMGDKVLARRLAAEAGLPLIPGTETDIQDDQALEEARRIGFPVMVKAAEGGGGIGIRIVPTAEELQSILQRSRFMAESAFGSGRMYMEKYIDSASHVEIQVLADHHGNAVHLYERDCSVQRRNQKVIEETPCAKIDDDLRRQMTEASIQFVRKLGYVNAGTIEFLVDGQGNFYFLEMNTRLQVEHAITEMVTGLDLVELQLRVAAGERLPLKQEDIKPRGHAIEARIYPEDPDTLTPVAGVATKVSEPEGEYIRVDGALFSGYEVSTYYEPMMAKLIVWGEDRRAAITRMVKALDEFIIEGVPSNIPVIKRVLEHNEYGEHSYDIKFLERLLQEAQDDGNNAEIAAAIAAAISVVRGQDEEMPSRWRQEGRRRQMIHRLNSGVPW
jgi:acetyl-CoA carboxylase biotin carboxylase subunit